MNNRMKVYIEINGGIGNQLFGYSFGYAAARKNNAELLLDTNMSDNNLTRQLSITQFPLSYDGIITYRHKTGIFDKILFTRLNRRKEIGYATKIIREKKRYEYDKAVQTVNRDTWFRGYWQNYRYFTDYSDEIERMLIKKRMEGKNNSLSARSRDALAIHVRRGDYKNIKGWSLPMRFYDYAIARMKTICDFDRIVIFSDDKTYSLEYFSKYNDIFDITVNENSGDASDLDEFLTMSSYRNLIMANSSFSWWAGFIGHKEKNIICPVYHNWKKEFYPPSWESIDLDEIMA